MTRKVLSTEGYKKINEMNMNYNIEWCEITDMEEFEVFRDKIFWLMANTCIIRKEDADYMRNLQDRIDAE